MVGESQKNMVARERGRREKMRTSVMMTGRSGLELGPTGTFSIFRTCNKRG